MLLIKKLQKNDMETLFSIAVRSFEPDYYKYGVYPPLLNMKRKKFSPPRIFGKAIFANNTIVGGAFILAFGKKGEIGAIFIDPNEQHKGYGKQVMIMIEEMYPKVRRWKLETPGESYGLHRFYESVGYIKAGEWSDKKSGMLAFQYEKAIKTCM